MEVWWCLFLKGDITIVTTPRFPPQTALDAARDFPQWQVIGADLQFDPYVLYDSEGNYA